MLRDGERCGVVGCHGTVERRRAQEQKGATAGDSAGVGGHQCTIASEGISRFGRELDALVRADQYGYSTNHGTAYKYKEIPGYTHPAVIMRGASGDISGRRVM